MPMGTEEASEERKAKKERTEGEYIATHSKRLFNFPSSAGCILCFQSNYYKIIHAFDIKQRWTIIFFADASSLISTYDE